MINIIYRELLVRRSECTLSPEETDAVTDGNCRQVMMSLMSAEINISRL